MKNLWIATLTALTSATALADEVQLTNGRTLVGIAHDETDRWMVETRLGDIRVPKSEVRSMVPGRTAVHEYRERLEAYDGAPTASELFDLALWARDEGFDPYVNPLLTQTIELEPNHRGARRMLGYVHHDGQWMTTTARNTLIEVQESVNRRASRPPAIARPRPEPEQAPYYLGIRVSQQPRVRSAYGPYMGY